MNHLVTHDFPPNAPAQRRVSPSWFWCCYLAVLAFSLALWLSTTSWWGTLAGSVVGGYVLFLMVHTSQHSPSVTWLLFNAFGLSVLANALVALSVFKNASYMPFEPLTFQVTGGIVLVALASVAHRAVYQWYRGYPYKPAWWPGGRQ